MLRKMLALVKDTDKSPEGGAPNSWYSVVTITFSKIIDQKAVFYK